MGVITDLWKKITDWVENAIRNALNWIAEKIEDFTVWLKVTRHKFNLWLADFANTDLGFWILLGGTVLFVMGMAFIGKSDWAVKAMLAVNTFLAKTKLALGSILEVLHYSEIYSLNEIAKILIPQYRKMWDGFYKAMGALAEELGLGVGTITAFLRNSNHIILSTYTSIGYTPDEAEVIYMAESNEFFSKVDSRFAKYARDPESIFSDINNEIVLPHLLAKNEKDYKLALTLNNVVEKTNEINNNLLVVENNIKTLIDDLPDELDTAISKRTDVFFETIDDFRDEHITPVLKQMDDINNVVKSYINTEIRQREVWEDLLSKPVDLILQIETLPKDERDEQRLLLGDYIGSLDLNGMSNISEDWESASQIDFDGLEQIKPDEDKLFLDSKTIENLDIKANNIKSSVLSWFVGEY